MEIFINKMKRNGIIQVSDSGDIICSGTLYSDRIIDEDIIMILKKVVENLEYRNNLAKEKQQCTEK